MMSYIDQLLDRISMYRLVLGYLAALLAGAVIASFFGVVPFSPIAIGFSIAIFVAAALVSNYILAYFFDAIPGNNSSLITALILSAIISPVLPTDIGGAILLALIAATAIASKYLLAYKNKHVFNPAAFGAVIASLVFAHDVSWWTAGTLWLLPIILVGGLLTARKISRLDAFIAFGISALATVAVLATGAPLSAMYMTLIHAPLFFMGLTMLTDPGTLPPQKDMRIAYGILVGIWFAPGMHIGSFYFSPQLALLLGNLFVFFVAPRGRHTLTLVERKEIARNTYEMSFVSDQSVSFTPGQYMEWTVPAGIKNDSRGNRRYLTIASAPHEKELRVAFRATDAPSRFKQTLLTMKRGDKIAAGQLSGDFVLPKDPNKKIAFIAGGIGITPFRSMVAEMMRLGMRNTVLLYANKSEADIAYRELLEEARTQNGLQTIYALSDGGATHPYTHNGFIDAALIQREIPDCRERLFYISGPSSMVSTLEETLQTLGIPKKRIRTDYFSGY